MSAHAQNADNWKSLYEFSDKLVSKVLALEAQPKA